MLNTGILKVPKQGEAKMDGVINQKNYKFNQFETQNIKMLSNATNKLKSTAGLGYMCPRRLSGLPAVTLTK